MFGDYISVYDIHRAVDDGAMVPIYYESRMAKLEPSEEEQPRIDAEFKEVKLESEQKIREGAFYYSIGKVNPIPKQGLVVYDGRVHLILDAKDITFDLGGISGCSLWRMIEEVGSISNWTTLWKSNSWLRQQLGLRTVAHNPR